MVRRTLSSRCFEEGKAEEGRCKLGHSHRDTVKGNLGVVVSQANPLGEALSWDTSEIVLYETWGINSKLAYKTVAF